MGNVFEQIREACAYVSTNPRWVRIDNERLRSYAAEISDTVFETQPEDPGHVEFPDIETTVAFVVAMDAVNFGSGYFPYILKRPAMSGYHTMASSLRDFVRETNSLTADQLRSLTPQRCAEIFGQLPTPGPAFDLMALFSDALNQLGERVATTHGGRFTTLIESCDNSAAALVAELDQLPFFRDVARYRGRAVPLYKRAQITANDLALTFGGEGPGRFDDIDSLTMFPDNLVPHVLRVDGLLRFDDELVDRINCVEDIESGSEPEVEIRAVGLHAVELLSSHLRQLGVPALPRDLDTFLWTRGAADRYKGVPRHRSRSVFY